MAVNQMLFTKELIFHSDRGTHMQSQIHSNILKSYEWIGKQKYEQKGNCWIIAVSRIISLTSLKG